jgi:hypothetical protein
VGAHAPDAVMTDLFKNVLFPGDEIAPENRL